MRLATALVGAALAVGGMAAAEAQRVEQANDWRLAATEDDRVRLRGWRSAWVKGLAQARTGGSAADIAALGELADPDHSVAEPDLPDGDYRCRTIKLGSQGRATLTYVAYPYFRCRVAGGGQRLTKIDGSQRLTGRIYPDTDARSIFLGTMILGDEERSYAYGRDRARDMAGVVERIDPTRWRIAFPYPAYESVVDILELVPVAP
ncbi:DUF4893 domain-containing protein [Sphingomonas fuzhouensis]|uniref:DUF4893 domain-containing protein n=1 Tax=Sphingomonas fuzhouensis TaxID=3106033 RepID=UPI002AFDF084|nr:DUF4893 domain-containing protein [Sphingomonas sp. SGZ-02]